MPVPSRVYDAPAPHPVGVGFGGPPANAGHPPFFALVRADAAASKKTEVPRVPWGAGSAPKPNRALGRTIPRGRGI